VNILFVCSKNKWRSRTAETIFQSDQRHKVRSAGTENDARIRITEKLINWADLIFVMEKRHKERLEEKYGLLMGQKQVIILYIQDEYKYMDSELIETLRTSVSAHLDK
jgi:predicted protein tyrosine phosphatase